MFVEHAPGSCAGHLSPNGLLDRSFARFYRAFRNACTEALSYRMAFSREALLMRVFVADTSGFACAALATRSSDFGHRPTEPARPFRTTRHQGAPVTESCPGSGRSGQLRCDAEECAPH